jgi:protein TonB
MFQSVIHQEQSGRFGAGAGVSALVHAGLVAAVLFLSRGVVEEPPPPVRPKLVVQLQPRPPRGNPAPAPAKAAVQPQPRRKKKLVQPSAIPPAPLPLEAMPPPPAPAETFVSNLPVVSNSHPDGDDTNGDPRAEPSDLPANILPLEPHEEGPVVFATGMQQPKLLSGAAIQYTREALEDRVQGLLVARCVITREGDVEDCRISQGLPHMDRVVLSALETRRYSPVTWQGKPISVSYTFKIRLDLPR